MNPTPFGRLRRAGAYVLLATASFSAALLAPHATAQDATVFEIAPSRIASALRAIGSDAPEGLEPVRVTEAELRRALVYTLGTAQLEARKVDVFIDEEIRARIAQGSAKDAFAVTDDEVSAAVQETIDQIKAQYPTLPAEAVLGYNNVDPADLERMTAQSKLFEKVFLPDDPSDWPATTSEAIRASAGEEFLQKLIDGYEERKAAQEAQGDAAKAGQAMFQMLMRQMVMQALNSSAEVLTASDGLPPNVAMRVNGVDIETDEVYRTIAARITAEDRARAERWARKTALLEAVLAARGHLLDDEAFAEAYAEHAEPYAGSPISLEVIARNFMGFPSMEAYRSYYRLRESFRRSVADEINEDTLRAHLPRANRLLGVGTIDVEVILCSAFDFPNKSWPEGGWEAAAAEAREVAQELADSGGAAWDSLLDDYSDFWDPPAPTTPTQQQQQPKKKNKGRFGTLNRNELLQYLQESDYSLFVDGYSVADAIFFDVEPGRFGGPWRGPFGYYFAKVSRRVPPTRVQSLSNENYRKMVEDDWLSVRFNAFARAVEEAATAD
jgi:hypothetical protein